MLCVIVGDDKLKPTTSFPVLFPYGKTAREKWGILSPPLLSAEHPFVIQCNPLESNDNWLQPVLIHSKPAAHPMSCSIPELHISILFSPSDSNLNIAVPVSVKLIFQASAQAYRNETATKFPLKLDECQRMLTEVSMW